jgi:hypothetical protein
MKEKMVFYVIVASIICLLIGIVGKLTGTKFIVQSYTWMQISQTVLLLAIALGIAKLLELNKK